MCHWNGRGLGTGTPHPGPHDRLGCVHERRDLPEKWASPWLVAYESLQGDRGTHSLANAATPPGGSVAFWAPGWLDPGPNHPGTFLAVRRRCIAAWTWGACKTLNNAASRRFAEVPSPRGRTRPRRKHHRAPIAFATSWGPYPNPVVLQFCMLRCCAASCACLLGLQHASGRAWYYIYT